MEVSNIIYYTRQNQKSRTLSLRSLCMKDENNGLEAIFFVTNDTNDAQDLLDKLSKLIYEQLELEIDNLSYIRFKVTDAYGNTNYLKFQKQKNNILGG